MAIASGALLLLCTLILLLPSAVPPQGMIMALASIPALAGWCLGGLRAAAVVLLAAWTALDAARTLQDRLPTALTGTDVLAIGAICEFPRIQDGTVRFELATLTGDSHGLPARILVSWYDTDRRPAIGEVWQLRLRLKPPRGTSNPGAFDFERWLFTRGIGATGWVRVSSFNRRLTGAARHCPEAAWRGRLAQGIRGLLGPRPALPYVLGLSVGAYQVLPTDEWESLRRTGTVHLISISGFHITLAALPFGIAGLLVGRVLLATGLRCIPRLVGAWTAVLAAGGYGLLAGFTVPTIRSVLMVLVCALCLSARRSISGASVLGACLMGVVALEPRGVLTPGLWLSFAGVAILGSALQGTPLGRDGSGTGGTGSEVTARAGHALAGLLRAQLAMSVGLVPLLVLFFGQIPAAGALANLVAVPAFSLILVPLTLLGTAAVALNLDAAGPLLELAAASVDVWRQFLAACASLPLAVWTLPKPSAGALLLAGVGAAFLLWPRPWPARPLGILLLTALAGGREPVAEGEARITVLDVGQGLSVLVQTAGHALLYDAGPAFRSGDAGERVVVPALQALGIRRLDMLLTSHPDQDHTGGAAAVLGRYPHARLLGAGAGTGAEADQRPPEACTGGRSWTWDGVVLRILHPPAGGMAAADNDTSCVLRVETPGGSVLLTGDIQKRGEAQLLAAGPLPRADLVLAPHHGSRTSSTQELVATLRPRYAVFSAGYANRWRFPAPEVVERWQQVGSCTLSTDREGMLTFASTPGRGLRLVTAYRRDEPRLWRPREGRSASCD